MEGVGEDIRPALELLCRGADELLTLFGFLHELPYELDGYEECEGKADEGEDGRSQEQVVDCEEEVPQQEPLDILSSEGFV